MDVFLNNAGIFTNNRVILPNSFETMFMVNHMSVFALTVDLLDMIKQSPQGRIVATSSMAQSSSIDFNNLNCEKYWDPYNAYAVSKHENVMFTYKLARLLKAEKRQVTVNCLNPGVIGTKLLYAGWGMGAQICSKGLQHHYI